MQGRCGGRPARSRRVEHIANEKRGRAEGYGEEVGATEITTAHLYILLKNRRYLDSAL